MQCQLSIISPVYKAENIIDLLVAEIITNVSKITNNFEIILVEDGSPDNSWQEIKKNCLKEKKVKGVKLSRNFGQHYAITAGLAMAKGEWIVVMDCDLQDRPDQIEKLYLEAMKGYDIVFAKRTVRQDGFFKVILSKLYYRVFGYLTDTKQDASVANFGIYHKKAIKAILSMNDYIRYFPTMSQWVGYRKAYLEVAHGKREEGESSYTWRSLFKLAQNNIFAFSDKPLRLTVRFGLFISGISGIIGLHYIFSYLSGKIVVLGYASLIISIWFLSGIIILTLGILGIYLGNIFDKVKGRPTYIIDQQINFIDEFQ